MPSRSKKLLYKIAALIGPWLILLLGRTLRAIQYDGIAVFEMRPPSAFQMMIPAQAFAAKCLTC